MQNQSKPFAQNPPCPEIEIHKLRKIMPTRMLHTEMWGIRWPRWDIGATCSSKSVQNNLVDDSTLYVHVPAFELV